jgi:hypothetical protein
MITAERLTLLTTYNAGALQKALGTRADGYDFIGAKFLGITNGGQFCYSVVFGSPDFKGTDSTKVYLTYNPAADQVIADMA